LIPSPERIGEHALAGCALLHRKNGAAVVNGKAQTPWARTQTSIGGAMLFATP